MSNRNRTINTGNNTSNVVDAEVLERNGQPVEGERPLPPAEQRPSAIGGFLNHKFSIMDVVKGAAIIGGGVLLYNAGKKKGRKQARSEYDNQCNEYEADYRQLPDDEPGE